MANHALPTISSTYVNFVSELQGRIDDAVKESNSATVTLTNPPTGMVRWNSASYYWEVNTGTPAAPVWARKSTRYDININGTVGEDFTSTGKFTTITTSGAASLGSGSTVGGATITTASNTQTLSNKTLTSPAISSISNSGTITIPTGTDTLVGRATTDTLTNKTFTDPKVSTGSAIKDANDVTLIKFPTAVASAVNYIIISNSATTTAPSITAAGSDTNVGIDIATKGTGAVTINGVNAVTASGTQTLTNKTLTLPVITSISNSGTVTIPAGTDTLVNLTGTQTLSNKTLTLPVITSISNSGTVTIPAGTDTLVNLTGTQTLSNKTLTLPVITSISNSGTVTIPAGTDTLVNLAGTQTISNKTINASAFNGTVGATTASTGNFTTVDASGNITSQGDILSYSDARLKKDLVLVSEAISKVKALNGYYYTRIDTGKKSIGLLAQEVHQVIPEAVGIGDYLSVNYGKLVGLLVEAIKELDKKIEKMHETTI